MSIHGVYFDTGSGSGSGLSQTAHIYSGNFSGIADSPLGTVSFWYRSLQPLTYPGMNPFTVLLGTLPSTYNPFFINLSDFTTGDWIGNNGVSRGGDITIFADDGVPTNRAYPTANWTWIADGFWHHIICSWDTNHASGSRLFSCVIDRFVTVTGSLDDQGSAFAVPYSALTSWTLSVLEDWGAGGDLAELWFAPGVMLDPTDTTVLNKFVDTGGNPVDLGADGSTPTGTAPILYLSCQSGTADDFLTNLGSGGGVFVLNGDSTLALAVSNADPVIGNPIRVLTPITATLTMRSTDYAGLDLSAAFGYLGHLGGGLASTSITILDGIGGLTVLTNPMQLDNGENVTPITAGFASLSDDGTSYSSYDITPPVAGINTSNNYIYAHGASNIYTAVIDVTSTPVLTFTIMPYATSLSVNGPYVFTSSSWMNTEMALSTPDLVAQMVWWNGQEQCIGLMDDALGTGNVALIAADGTMTDTTIWAGWGNLDSFNQTQEDAGLFLLCSPDSVSGNNRFLTSLGNSDWIGSTVMSVVADSSGAELSRSIIHAADHEIDSMINWFSLPSGGPMQYYPVTANEYGFIYVGQYSGTTDSILVQIDPEATQYTKYALTADPSDRIASIILNSSISGNASGYADATRKWLIAQNSAFTIIDFTAPNTTLVQDLNSSNDPSTFGCFPIAQVDTTVNGECIGSQFVLSGSGSTSYQPAATLVDPDYTVMMSVSGVVLGTGTPLPIDGDSMFMIGRADVSHNGYRVSVAGSGGTYHLQFQIMPSGSVTDIDMGTTFTGGFIGGYIFLFMVGSSIQVAAYNGGNGSWLMSDGTWSAPGGFDFPSLGFTPGAYAVSITDSTYADAGAILFGGVQV